MHAADIETTTKSSRKNACALLALALIAYFPAANGQMLPLKQDSLQQDLLERERIGSPSTTTGRNLGVWYPWYCLGDTRDDGNDYMLGKSEAICSDADDDLRFGLNEDGYVGLWSDYSDTVWFPGKKGDRLVLQSGDCNLVLYSGSRATWATDCRCRDGARGGRFYIDDEGAVTVKDSKNKVVWEMDKNGNDSECYPNGSGGGGGGGGGDRDPPGNCVGEARAAGNGGMLRKNQAICDYYDDDIRFGLNSKGYIGLWEGHDAVWFPGKKGDRLVQQMGDSNLVLYDGSRDTWASDCRAPSGVDGLRFQIYYGDVTVLDDNYDTVWHLDDDGSDSGCYPWK